MRHHINPRTEILAVLCALVLSMAFSASALADSHPDPLVQQITEQVAHAAFPGSPCEGRVSMTLQDRLSVTGTATEALGLAWMGDGSCRMELERKLLRDPVLYCHVWVHEYGHLAGHHHSDDPTSIMYFSASTQLKGCMSVLPPEQPTPSCSDALLVVQAAKPRHQVRCAGVSGPSRIITGRLRLKDKRKMRNMPVTRWVVYQPSPQPVLVIARMF